MEEMRDCRVHGISTFRKTERGHGWQCLLCKKTGCAKWADQNRKKIASNGKSWRLRNSEHVKNDARLRRTALRREVIDHYGGKCECCGEKRLRILCIDHINNDGSAHRKKIGMAPGNQFYKWIVKNGFPTLFRVLCHNCNNCMGSYGRCMHHPENIAAWWSEKVRNPRYEYMKKRGIELRIKVLSHYSKGKPECHKCSENTYEFLCLDHIDGGGVKHRAKLGKSGRSTYAFVVNNHFPEGFQVLCYNCNFDKGRSERMVVRVPR